MLRSVIFAAVALLSIASIVRFRDWLIERRLRRTLVDLQTRSEALRRSVADLTDEAARVDAELSTLRTTKLTCPFCGDQTFDVTKRACMKCDFWMQ